MPIIPISIEICRNAQFSEGCLDGLMPETKEATSPHLLRKLDNGVKNTPLFQVLFILSLLVGLAGLAIYLLLLVSIVTRGDPPFWVFFRLCSSFLFHVEG